MMDGDKYSQKHVSLLYPNGVTIEQIRQVGQKPVEPGRNKDKVHLAEVKPVDVWNVISSTRQPEYGLGFTQPFSIAVVHARQ